MSLASMTPERREKVCAVLDAVRYLDDDARAAKLEELCGNDHELRADVEQILALDAYATFTGGTGVDGRTLLHPSSVTAPTLSFGQALGRYRLRKLLGRGGMGVVLQADDEQLQRPVAIKMVAGRAMSDDAGFDQFRTEAMAVARLVHPNVVQVYDWGECESGPYFVMEYVAGGSLAERLRCERMPAIEAVRLVRLLARAVHAAHQRGIIHRDLKPGNIFLAPQSDEPAFNCVWGCPKIGDFGLALRLDADDVPAGALAGTPAYMSPEQAAGDTAIGPASDVFSLGVILYELLTGTKPFEGRTTAEVLQAVRKASPVPPTYRAALPVALERVCLLSLKKNPAKRYATALEFAEALARVAAKDIWTVAPKTRIGPWDVLTGLLLLASFAIALVFLVLVLIYYASSRFN